MIVIISNGGELLTGVLHHRTAEGIVIDTEVTDTFQYSQLLVVFQS
jgi:hypothetical protein